MNPLPRIIDIVAFLAASSILLIHPLLHSLQAFRGFLDPTRP
jgi:hypothetical protein